MKGKYNKIKNKDFLLEIKEELKKYSYIPGEIYDDIVMVVVRGKQKNLVPLLTTEKKGEYYLKTLIIYLKRLLKLLDYRRQIYLSEQIFIQMISLVGELNQHSLN